MSAPDRGTLIPNFSVRCGMCTRHTINGISSGVAGMAGTKKQAARALKRHGWAFTRAWGWICPKCEAAGCATRTRELSKSDAGRLGNLPGTKGR
jgi:hypothetical protein